MKLKKILLSIVCVVSSIFTYSQLPTLQWAKSLGGSYQAQGYSIVFDNSGNVYTTGHFQGTSDFDPGYGTYNLTAPLTGLGNSDIYISKLDSYGNFIWAKSIGDTLYDYGTSIVVDTNGNVYTTGLFKGTADFDPGIGIFNLTSVSSGGDMFISKLDASGSFVWAKSIEGSIGSQGYSISLDKFGNSYTTGFFYGTVDFDPGPGIFNLSSAFSGLFITKLDATGNFVWAKKMDGTSFSSISGHSIAIDDAGNIYNTGWFYGTVDFDPSAGIFNLSSLGGPDIFVSKLDSSGNLVWVKSIGDTIDDIGLSLAVDVFGNVYTTGFFTGTADFDPGPGTFNISSSSVGDYVIFISKLDSSGNFVWAKNMGSGTPYDAGNSIALDTFGNVYSTGKFYSTTDFDPGFGIFNITPIGNDVFISKLDSSGNYIWACAIGGPGYDVGRSIAVDLSGNIYTTGVFDSGGDFDPSIGVFNLTSAGGWNIFVHKMGQSGVGISEINNEKQISIYPNPTSGSFNIFTSEQIKNGSIEIYNTIGELIYSQKIINQQNSIDLKNQASGLYFVKVISDGEVIGMKKVVKE